MQQEGHTWCGLLGESRTGAGEGGPRGQALETSGGFAGILGWPYRDLTIQSDFLIYTSFVCKEFQTRRIYRIPSNIYRIEARVRPM